MATLPFTGAFIARLQDPTHAYRFTCEIGEVVHFLFYCCEEPYSFSIEKAPVARLNIAPDTQCANVAIAANLDNSYVPLGTIATWRISWGDGTADDVPGPAFPPGNRPHTYTTAGTYTMVATVTDTLGNSGSVQVQVLIVDCTDAILIEQMYALSQTAGPYVRDMTVVPPAVPAWVQRARGLTGTYLQGVDLKLDPHTKDLPFGQRHVWIVTNEGPARSTTDCAFWSRLAAKLPVPRNGAGVVVADLSWYCVAFNPRNVNEVYILAGIIAPNNRAWVYFTTDGGVTWDNWQVNR